MGLSVGLGFAIGAQRKSLGFQSFVMIGDGELQEGMIWEALHVAPRYQVANLTAILDSNGLQQFGWFHEAGATGRGDRRGSRVGGGPSTGPRGPGVKPVEVKWRDV